MLMVYARGLEWIFKRPLGKAHREQARAKDLVLCRSLIGWGGADVGSGSVKWILIRTFPQHLLA